MSAQVVTAFVFGVVFVVGLIVLAITFPRPTPFQYNVFRVVLALAAAGVVAMIPGFINLEVSVIAGLLIRAGGALAVFAVVFFFNPAQLAIQGASQEQPEPSAHADFPSSGVATEHQASTSDGQEGLTRTPATAVTTHAGVAPARSHLGLPAGVGDAETVKVLYSDEQVSVSLVRHRITGELSVLKEYPEEYFRPLRPFSVEDPGVVLPNRRWKRSGRAFELASYVDSWTLHEVVVGASSRPVVTGGLLETWFKRLAKLLATLHGHSPPIVHNDISPYNVLVRKHNLDLCLIDFTLAETLDEKIGKVYGHPGYIDPLRAKGERQLSSDLFSLGCLLYYMNTGDTPPRVSEREYYGESMRLREPRISRKYLMAYAKMVTTDMIERFNDAGQLVEYLSQRTGTRVADFTPRRLTLPDGRVVLVYDYHWEIDQSA